MPHQLDLVPPAELVAPSVEGRAEPRFWIRRLIVWKEPGVVVREETFRPGLNIIWSPDPADEPAAEGGPRLAIGHGSGKTLLCRLLRYCLGEPRFAPDGQRQQITNAFKDGLVGVEVVLDGVPWAIVRSIGHRHHHAAVEGKALAEVVVDGPHPDGITPFLEAVSERLITPAVATLIPGQHPHHAWLLALAWLARDQECRFEHLLSWRSAVSGSGSPARARDISKTDLVYAIRAFLYATTPEDQLLREKATQLAASETEVEQRVRHLKWDQQRRYQRLLRALNLTEQNAPLGEFGIAVLRKSARTALAKLAQTNTVPNPQRLKHLQGELEGARAKETEIKVRLREIAAKIPILKREQAQIAGQLPGLRGAVFSAKNPTCPICEVPIDRALAEGCGLSRNLPDLAACQERRNKLQHEAQICAQELAELRTESAELEQKLPEANSQTKKFQAMVEREEAALSARPEHWFQARQLVSDVEKLADSLGEGESAKVRHRQIKTEREKVHEAISEGRDSQGEVLGRFSQVFDGVVRVLAGPDAKGRLKLTGKGLKAIILLGGERSTPAMDSLKVLAFDLAALLLAAQDRAAIPAFLMHDSPREADLGLSVYHGLFYLMKRLEGEQPLFQYIITTTTRPPAALQKKPWVRVKLHGAPASERLLRRDL